MYVPGGNHQLYPCQPNLYPSVRLPDVYLQPGAAGYYVNRSMHQQQQTQQPHVHLNHPLCTAPQQHNLGYHQQSRTNTHHQISQVSQIPLGYRDINTVSTNTGRSVESCVPHPRPIHEAVHRIMPSVSPGGISQDFNNNFSHTQRLPQDPSLCHRYQSNPFSVTMNSAPSAHSPSTFGPAGMATPYCHPPAIQSSQGLRSSLVSNVFIDQTQYRTNQTYTNNTRQIHAGTPWDISGAPLQRYSHGRDNITNYPGYNYNSYSSPFDCPSDKPLVTNDDRQSLPPLTAPKHYLAGYNPRATQKTPLTTANYSKIAIPPQNIPTSSLCVNPHFQASVKQTPSFVPPSQPDGHSLCEPTQHPPPPANVTSAAPCQSFQTFGVPPSVGAIWNPTFGIRPSVPSYVPPVVPPSSFPPVYHLECRPAQFVTSQPPPRILGVRVIQASGAAVFYPTGSNTGITEDVSVIAQEPRQIEGDSPISDIDPLEDCESVRSEPVNGDSMGNERTRVGDSMGSTYYVGKTKTEDETHAGTNAETSFVDGNSSGSSSVGESSLCSTPGNAALHESRTTSPSLSRDQLNAGNEHDIVAAPDGPESSPCLSKMFPSSRFFPTTPAHYKIQGDESLSFSRCDQEALENAVVAVMSVNFSAAKKRSAKDEGQPTQQSTELLLPDTQKHPGERKEWRVNEIPFVDPLERDITDLSPFFGTDTDSLCYSLSSDGSPTDLGSFF
eukprot:GHVQ01029347.1.p1 GENE.GHVQ01029347.1~~GHVQ01029347.1.p1  ORF type:complete len:722 (-),score=88.09 GHVQ01029347.1:235-2400(-)